MNTMNKKNPPKGIPWFSLATGIAWVAGIYSLVVAGLLIANYITLLSGLPEKERIYSKELVDFKEQLNQDPRNEELKQKIRQLDVELRQAFFQRQAFAERGKYLLLAGIAIFLLAMKKVMSIPPPPTRKKNVYKEPEYEATRLMQVRKAVTVVACILVAGSVTLSFLPTVDFASLSSDALTSGESIPAFPTQEEIQQNWPMFRGPDGWGVAAFKVPTAWDGASGEGILWKTEILLPGNNSPIVWGNHVFISGANETSKEVYGYSADKGALLWKGSVNDVPGHPPEKVDIMEGTGAAASTMACDGSRVYAIFYDGDIACFDLQGQRLWAKNMGIPDSIYGFASSLAFYQNRVLIQYDQGGIEDGKSVVYALEGENGSIAWQTKRPVANSWTSPILIHSGTDTQLITCSEPWVISYDPATGEELWRANLLGTDLAPSATFAHGLVIVIQPNETVYALRPDGRGDVTKTHVAWSKDCIAPDISSPVSNGELIFLLTSNGYLTCLDATTGDIVWEDEIEDDFQASPILAGEWIYLFSENGITYRIKAARTFEKAEEEPKVDEWIRATPAFMKGRIYLRGDRYLYCIGEK